MAIDKSKIFAKACHVYVAARTDPNTPVPHIAGTDWTDIGSLKMGSAKISTELHEIQIHTGEKVLTGVTLKFDAEGMETDAAKLTILETLLNKVCDVILRPKVTADTAAIKLLGLNISYGLEGPYSGTDAIVCKLAGSVMASKPSDVYLAAVVSWVK
ncbi:MAG: hypothetical protein QME58_13885 [Bacteroidota bacterium]|nr:hypothetical protein [Bacteroidota bacterium]